MRNQKGVLSSKLFRRPDIFPWPRNNGSRKFSSSKLNWKGMMRSEWSGERAHLDLDLSEVRNWFQLPDSWHCLTFPTFPISLMLQPKCFFFDSQAWDFKILDIKWLLYLILESFKTISETRIWSWERDLHIACSANLNFYEERRPNIKGQLCLSGFSEKKLTHHRRWLDVMGKAATK